MTKYYRQKHAVFNIGYHLIFSTKYRKPYFLNHEKMIKRAFKTSSIKMNFIVKQVNIMPDHIHLFIKCKVNHYSVPKIVQQLKGYSSYYVRKNSTYAKKYKAFYSPSYFAESIGNINANVVKKYIRNQKINLKSNYKYSYIVKKYNKLLK